MTKGGSLLSCFACWRDWVPRGIAVLALALSGVGAAHADDVAIGSLQLGYVNGYQQASFYNLTGPGLGCDGVEYEVCNGITIDSWALTLTFTAEGDTDPATDGFVSPLTFSSQSPADEIGPYGGVAPYTGGASGTWQIPLYVGNPGEPACPPCDYQLTQVEFSGTIDPLDLPLTVGSPGNTSTFAAQPTFDSIWAVPPIDYTGLTNPEFFGDAVDVLVSPASSVASIPEPASLPLLGGELLFVIGLLKLLCSRAANGRFRRADRT